LIKSENRADRNARSCENEGDQDREKLTSPLQSDARCLDNRWCRNTSPNRLS